MACQFKSKAEDVVCAIDFIDANTINQEDYLSVVTECGLLSNTCAPHLYRICTAHYTHFASINDKRRKRKYCGIPSLVSTHDEGNRRKERVLTLKQIQLIQKIFGIVVPLGTGKLIFVLNI